MATSNKWYVITGAPSSGKTTVIKLLEKKGYGVVYEAARIYIDREIAKGKTLDEIRKSEISFQEKVLKMKIEREKNLPKEKIIFFDRGIPDSDAYYRLHGVGEDKFLKESMNKCAYKKVFLFEMIGYEKDYARNESKEQQLQIQNLLKDSYEKLNIPVVMVPKIPPDRRLDCVLNNL